MSFMSPTLYSAQEIQEIADTEIDNNGNSPRSEDTRDTHMTHVNSSNILSESQLVLSITSNVSHSKRQVQTESNANVVGHIS